MARQDIVIRRRWWAHLMTLYVAAVMVFLAWVALFAIQSVFLKTGWWWKSAIFMAIFAFMLHGIVVATNAMFRYRVIVGRDGLRIKGNFYSHDIRWEEIETIRKRNNFRVPGYHVEIHVDGSNNPKRHWCNYWTKGYFIHPGMEKGGIALASYLNRKRREALRRMETEKTLDS